MDTTTEQPRELTPAELRREARKQKILQSSKSRLQKLSSGPRCNEKQPTESDTPEVMQYSDPEIEQCVPPGRPFLQEESPIFAPTNLTTEKIRAPNRFIRSKIHIFCASILGYVLSLYVPNSLFAPVLLCLIVELFYFKEHQNAESNIISTLLPFALLYVSYPLLHKMKQINQFLSISQSVINSLAVNIFCICISSYIYQYYNLSHIVDIK